MSGILSAGGAGAVGVSGFYPVQINDSLRFEDGSSAYLNRTFSSAPSSTTTSTFSTWAKRGNLGQYMIWTSYVSGPNIAGYIYFNTSNKLQVYVDKTAGGSDELNVTTDAVFRDPSAFYHIVVKYDLSQASNSNKIKIYVNGELQSATYSQTGSAVTAHRLVSNGTLSNIGQSFNNTNFYDGYLAEINFIDGQALDPTSFGEAKDGTWIPKSYSGSYGTNGFHLEFNSNTNDTSGNSNNWTANNISAHDYVPDSPTNNFATLNPLDAAGISSSFYLHEGNLAYSVTNNSAYRNTSSTFFPEGLKGYYEFSVTTGTPNFYLGMYPATSNPSAFLYSTTNTIALLYNGALYNGSTILISSMFSAFSTGDVGMVAFDFTGSSKYIWFGKNGSWGVDGSSNTQDPAGGNNPAYTFTTEQQLYFASNTGAGIQTIVANFGQDSTFAGATTAGGNADGNGRGDFKYSVPSGYLALCTANLPEPTIIDGSENFNTVLYSGNGGTQSITGVGFQPDFVWLKGRNFISNNRLNDVVRGASNSLKSNATSKEDTTSTNYVTSFDSDGFSLNSGNGDVNQSGGTFASWNWKASTAFSNSAGSNGATIASSGRVNTDAGFSIVSYVGTGSAGTVYHGLSSTPEFITIKDRDYATGRPWGSYHFKLNNGVNPEDERIQLNESTAETNDTFIFNSTAPTSNVFSLGTSSWNNISGNNIIAYCFHSVDGYSKVGQYIGNYNVDGPFVYTGFRPAFIIIKSAVTTGYSWYMMDSTRTAYNGSQAWLSPDQAVIEDTSTGENVDILSNGFKIRTNWTRLNDSGSPRYIYIAFAETPQKFANAR